MNISKILGALPDLSKAELQTVIACASALQATKGGSGGAQSAGRSSRKKKKEAKPQPTSRFAGVAEYQSFKTADKALRAFLKEKGITLKEATESKEHAKHDLVTSFLESRDAWFQKKADLAAQQGLPEARDASATSKTSPAHEHKEN
jgi:hypothetical protein